MSKKSTSSKAKGKASPSVKSTQPTGETAPQQPATTLEPLTERESQELQMLRAIRQDVKAAKQQRSARIDALAEWLKAIDSDDDLDKVEDFVGRITGTGGHFISPRGDGDYEHMFRQLSLHLACAFIQAWLGVEGMFDDQYMSAEASEAYSLAEFVPWINAEIWKGIDNGLLDDNALINWINSSHNKWSHIYHAEWVDERGVQVWLGERSKNLRLEADAKDGSDATTNR